MNRTPEAAPSLTARIADRFFRTRWLVRLPIGVYRAGFGSTRPSGPGREVIIAGFAGKAQWYRNITANPRVRVSTGFRRNMAALAEPMPPAESAAVLRTFIEHVSGRPVGTMPMVRLRVRPEH